MRLKAEAPRSAGGRLIAGATVAVAVLAAGSPAHGSFPGRNGDIAFAARFECGYDRSAIGVMRPDGSEPKQVSDCEYFTYGPSWFPDGRSLSYTSYFGTWVISADGSQLRKTSLGSDPSVAPDGRHYAYVRRRGPIRRIWRASIHGGEGRHLRAGRLPLWSPDGRTIAYYRKGVWLMNARSGQRLRRVASRRMSPLDWSPDGRRLLLRRNQTNDTDLYTVRADGSGRPGRLTRTPSRAELYAAWSSDGQRIVFAASTQISSFFFQFTVSTMGVSGRDETVIWTGEPFEGGNEEPSVILGVSWQPLSG
jgi:Tol biopolymer transport system component